MALAQAIASSFACRQASGFIEAQTGEATGDKGGNLFDPVEGDARIDGEGTDRVLATRGQFVTSDGMAVLKAGLVGALSPEGGNRHGPRGAVASRDLFQEISVNP